MEAGLEGRTSVPKDSKQETYLCMYAAILPQLVNHIHSFSFLEEKKWDEENALKCLSDATSSWGAEQKLSHGNMKTGE